MPDEKKQPAKGEAAPERNVAHTPDGVVPDPDAPRVGKEVLTEEDAKKAS